MSWALLIAWGCCSKLPQTWWLLTIESLTDQEALCNKISTTEWNQGASRATTPAEVLGAFIPCLSHHLGTSAFFSWGCTTPISTSVATLPPLLLIIAFLCLLWKGCLWLYLGFIQIILGHLPTSISLTQSHLKSLCHITLTVPSIRTWASWGEDHCSTYHMC